MSERDFDFDFEPVPGLPETLPEGEKLIWQGSPEPLALAVEAFRLRWVAAYFACLGVWRFASAVHDGESAGAIAISLAWLALLAAASIGILIGLGWLMARGTIYSITSQRLVIRHGVAMPMSINVPFSKVDGASYRAGTDGRGDIPLRLSAGNRLSYLALWPHARPMRFTKPEPMLRAVADAETVAGTLAKALAAASEQPLVRVRTTPRDTMPTPAAIANGGMAVAS